MAINARHRSTSWHTLFFLCLVVSFTKESCFFIIVVSLYSTTFSLPFSFSFIPFFIPFFLSFISLGFGVFVRGEDAHHGVHIYSPWPNSRLPFTGSASKCFLHLTFNTSDEKTRAAASEHFSKKRSRSSVCVGRQIFVHKERQEEGKNSIEKYCEIIENWQMTLSKN